MDQELQDASPKVPPRKKHPAKTKGKKEDGGDITSKKVRPVAIVPISAPDENLAENKIAKEQPNVKKGTRPPRPPPPVRTSSECDQVILTKVKTANDHNENSSSNVKLKPTIPARPNIARETVCPNKTSSPSPTAQIEGKPVSVNVRENDNEIIPNSKNLSRTESNTSYEIVARKPKPTPRPRPRPDSKPIPQPRKPVAANFIKAELKQDDKGMPLKVTDMDSSLKKNEIQNNSSCEEQIDDSVVKKVAEDTEVVLVNKQNGIGIDTIPLKSEIDINKNYTVEHENVTLVPASIINIVEPRKSDIDSNNENTIRKNMVEQENDICDVNKDGQSISSETIAQTNHIFDANVKSSSVDILKDSVNGIPSNENGTVDDHEGLITSGMTNLRGKSFGNVGGQNFIRKLKRSFSANDLLESQKISKQKSNNEIFLEKCNKGRECLANMYENVHLQSKSNICDVDSKENRNDVQHNDDSDSNIQKNIKQTVLGNKHSYQNVSLHDEKSQVSSFSDSFILLQNPHKNPVFFLPKIHHKSTSLERHHSNSCDTVYLNEALSAENENIYHTPPKRGSENDIYASPRSSGSLDPCQVYDLPKISNSLSSSVNSDRSSHASVESSRFSIASNSSHMSVGDKTIPYENVDISNGDNVSKDSSLSFQLDMEVIETDANLPVNSNRKQERTSSRKEPDDTLCDTGTSYMNVLPPEETFNGTYIEIDFSKHKENALKYTVNKPKVPKLPSNSFLPTTLLDEAKSFLSTQGASGKKHAGRVSTVLDEATGEYRNYFESSDEDESEDLLEKPKSKLFSIANEILTTERSFVTALKLICEDFGGALKAAMGRNTKLLPDGAYSIIFMNIEQIFELDKKFLQELEERMQHWDLHQRIGDLVRAYGHFLKMYTVYIKGYDSAIQMFHDCLGNNMKFLHIVEEFEKSPKAKNMKLSSFMLKPIQRIPSYRLLLIDYLKNLPEDHLDYRDISDGLDIVSEVASHINESMKEGEKFQEVLRIQSLITNCKDIVKPGRYLIKEGLLQKLSRKELQQRAFILFTDALLYCSCMGSQMKLINELPLVGMTVQIPDSQDLNNEFVVISTKRSFLLNASSSKEREEWVEAIEGAVQVANEKVGTFITKRDTASTLLNTELGHIAPPWIPDNRATMCQICTDAFTVYNRRHHCRACGKLVCNDCSAYEAPLKYMDFVADRVCSICYQQLLDQDEWQQDASGDRFMSRFKETKAKKRKNRQKSLPSTLTEVTAQEEGIQNSGFLRIKKGGKKEKRYWFVLKDYVLYTYKASSDPAASSTFPVLGYEVREAGNWKEGEFIFTLSHAGVKDTLVLRADSETTAERWVHCLKKATELAS